MRPEKGQLGKLSPGQGISQNAFPVCFPEASLPAPHGGSPWGGCSWLDEGSWLYPALSPYDGDTQTQEMGYKEGIRSSAAGPG